MSALAVALDEAKALPTSTKKAFNRVVDALDNDDKAALFRALDDRDESGRYRVSLRVLARQLSEVGHPIGTTTLSEVRIQRRVQQGMQS